MSKGKYTIQKRYLKAIDKQIRDQIEILPKWLKDIKKEKREKDKNEL